VVAVGEEAWVGVGDAVAVLVAVGVAVAVAVRVALKAAVAVAVGVRVPVGMAVVVLVVVGVAVGAGADVPLGVGVDVRVAVAGAVDVPVGVGVVEGVLDATMLEVKLTISFGAVIGEPSKLAANFRPQAPPVPCRIIDKLVPLCQSARLTSSWTTGAISSSVYQVLASHCVFEL
jgi:hypothetical protein